MDEIGGVFAPSRRALTAGILLSVTAIACEGMAVSTVMPSVAVELGGLGDYGWPFSAFMLASLIGAISAGRSADRDNVVAPARLGFLAFGAGLLIAGSAPLWLVFLLGRAVQGFGSGTLIAAAYVAVARRYPEPLRPRVMALLSSAWVLPALIGPAIAGQVAEHASWRLVFVGLLPPTALGAWMFLRSLADVPSGADAAAPEDQGRLCAAIRLTLGVGMILLAASVGVLVGSVALLVAGLVVSVPAFRKLLPEGTLTLRSGLPSAVALRGLVAFGFFGAEALIPLGLATNRDIAPSLLGLSLTAGGLAWVAGAWAQDRAEALADGSMPNRALRAALGLVLVFVGIGIAAVVVVQPNLPFELVVVGWLLSGLGMGLVYPATTLTALAGASSGSEGVAAASLQLAETIGTALGTGAVGALFALSSSLQRGASEGLIWGFTLAAGAALVAVVPALRLATASQLLRYVCETTRAWHAGVRQRRQSAP
jgi:MFS family permease